MDKTKNLHFHLSVCFITPETMEDAHICTLYVSMSRSLLEAAMNNTNVDEYSIWHAALLSEVYHVPMAYLQSNVKHQHGVDVEIKLDWWLNHSHKHPVDYTAICNSWLLSISDDLKQNSQKGDKYLFLLLSTWFSHTASLCAIAGWNNHLMPSCLFATALVLL